MEEFFTPRNILIVGDVMLDTYLFGNVERISPEAPVPVVDVIIKQDKLGGASNVALNIKELGGTPFLCSVLGDDTKSEIFLSSLKRNKISTDYIIKSKNRITTNKTRIIGNNHQMLRIDEEIKENLNQTEIYTLKEKIEAALTKENIDVILIQDYDKGVINKEIIDYLIQKSKELNLYILADPKQRNFNNYHDLSLFKPNFKEFKEGLNLLIEKDRIELLKYGSKILHKKGIEIIFVTLSENGIFISYKNGNGYKNKIIHGIPRNVSDVSGAGDTVIAIASMLIGIQFEEEIAKICNIGGGIVCEEVGVVPINKEKLLYECF